MKVEVNFEDMKTFKDWLQKFLEVEKEFIGDDLDLIVHVDKMGKSH